MRLDSLGRPVIWAALIVLTVLQCTASELRASHEPEDLGPAYFEIDTTLKPVQPIQGWSGTKLSRRAKASASEIANAHEVVKELAAQIKSTFNQTNAPKRNNYSLKPSTSVQDTAGNSTSTLFLDSSGEARALVAEVAAEDLSTKGRLFKEYRIATWNENGQVDYRTHQAPNNDKTLQSRQASPYWMAAIGPDYPGNNPFGSNNNNYKVFRNVRDYGARGNGRTDDTEAINRAIRDGDRCGDKCGGSTVKSATVYFPPGTYLISRPIISYFHTQLVGDPTNIPVLLAAPDFEEPPGEIGVITSNVYKVGRNERWNMDDEWYLNVGNFFRQVRNFVIDTSEVKNEGVRGMHWQVAQATSLDNVHFKMRRGSKQTGLFIENGSGGTLDGLSFEGGGIGMECGNQQYTSKNLVFDDCTVAISMLWDWGWLWKGILIRNSKVGIQFFGNDFPGGSLTLLDSRFENTGTGILVDQDSQGSKEQTTLLLLNVEFQRTPLVVDSRSSDAKLTGGTGLVESWIVGHTKEDGKGGNKTTYSAGEAGDMLGVAPNPADELLYAVKGSGILTKYRPQYEDRTDFIIASAKGDGRTDVTALMNSAFRASADTGRVLFLPAGSYIVTDTVLIPPGAKVVGMSWSQIVGSGPKFEDVNNPRPMVRVGEPGDEGSVEISDILFTARGPTAGLIAVEWNLKASGKGTAAMWDSHVRIGGAAGTNLQLRDCPKQTGVKKNCIAGSLMIHLTKDSSAYLDNVWAWVADHDLDHPPSFSEEQIDIYVARGVLVESKGPTWLWGTGSEHSVLYQYAFSGAENLFMGLAQTESAYFRPNPPAPEPFGAVDGDFPGDPKFSSCGQKGCAPWALKIQSSRDVMIVGAGFYSWFLDGYSKDCVPGHECQQGMVEVDSASSGIQIYNLFTVGSSDMITVRGGGSIKAADNMMLANKDPWTSCIAAWTRGGGRLPQAVMFSKASLDSFFEYTGTPEHCYGLDRCPKNVDEEDDPILAARAATEKKGYLCLMDAIITEVFMKREKQGKNYSWNYHVNQKIFDLNENCDRLDSNCPEAGSCSESGYPDPAFFWMLDSWNRYWGRVKLLEAEGIFAVQQADMTAIADAVKAVSDLHEEKQGLKKILKIVSQALSWAGFVVPHLKGPTAGSQQAIDRTAETLDATGMAFDTAQEHMDEGETELEKQQKLHDAIRSGLASWTRNAKQRMSETLKDFFNTGDMEGWPEHSFHDESFWKYKDNKGDPKTLQTKQARLLSDQTFITEITDSEVQDIANTTYGYLRSGIAMLALSPDNYYILKNGLPKDRCKSSEDHPTAKLIGQECFELHQQGVGWDKAGQPTIEYERDITVFTKPAVEAVKKLFDFEIQTSAQGSISSLELFYRASWECQEAARKQGKTSYPMAANDETNINLTIEPQRGGSPLSSCTLRMPVLEVLPWPTDDDGLLAMTPCIVSKRARDRGSDKGQLGRDILPDFLRDSVGDFDKFCQTKCGRACAAENSADRCIGAPWACNSLPTGPSAPAVSRRAYPALVNAEKTASSDAMRAEVTIAAGN